MGLVFHIALGSTVSFYPSQRPYDYHASKWAQNQGAYISFTPSMVLGRSQPCMCVYVMYVVHTGMHVQYIQVTTAKLPSHSNMVLRRPLSHSAHKLMWEDQARSICLSRADVHPFSWPLEDIHKLLVCGCVKKSDDFLVEFFSNKLSFNLNMLGAFMEYWIGTKLQKPLVFSA